MRKFTLFLLLLVASCIHKATANNLAITNIAVSGNTVSFSVQWDNSWNTMNNIDPLYPNNWDGVWVFVKYQNAIDNLWKHAKVSPVASDHTIAGSLLQIDPASDSMGVFIRRTNPGNGDIAATAVSLKIGPLIGTDSFNFKVFGTEVVYVPQGAFTAGDGNSSGVYYITQQSITASKEASGVAAGSLYAGSPAVAAAFPMGYNAFYAMKYEISNEQWVDFLNTLNYDQQVTRIAANTPQSTAGTAVYTTLPSGVSYIRTIRVQSPGVNNTQPAVFGCDYDNDGVFNETSDGQNLPMVGIGRADAAAILDWSGLRMMTELEYEKACRGSKTAVLNEFAWGTAALTWQKRANTSNQGLPNENVAGSGATNGNTFLTYSPFNSDGPGRVGLFATSTSGRETSGAGFYGIMELTGNAGEFVISADNGATFTGEHGNGMLTTTGEADVASWPPNTINQYLIKGNCWSGVPGISPSAVNGMAYAAASIRFVYAADTRQICFGGRGVRTAP